ncbi:hypothetical protein [Helicobacter sp. MIT 05-5294]|uniref:hypothetical protein n=1 Tax=Helicobacter sp. MIT 05-5294 TaxID=1548150 RepID=UPI00051F9577|nr:hypothetical protein [Helicobacter sp. MIT 05-5294]TLD88651.1 hypothetical protein LS69_001835 [Helicobacter sp. MIT 05-5294]
MSFKINTQPYKVSYPQVSTSTPIAKPSTSTPIKNTINTGKATTTPQVKYPTQNLLDKYRSPGSFYNAQNSLNHQFGIQNNSSSINSEVDEGKKALLENLQSQSNAFNYGINSGDSTLSWSDALGQYLELEDSALQKQLQAQQSQEAQSDFLNELLWNLKKNLPL